jgi:cell division transport system permease protein
MGAADDYVGRQFEQHALSNALRGGLVGFAIAIIVVGGFVGLSASAPDDGLPPLELGLLDWLLLGCVPVVAALLTTFLARWTARWGLARLR